MFLIDLVADGVELFIGDHVRESADRLENQCNTLPRTVAPKMTFNTFTQMTEVSDTRII